MEVDSVVEIPDAALVSSTKSEEIYVPSAVEKKRVFLIYMVVGIPFISREEHSLYSIYEKNHIHIAIGWWAVFVPFWFCTVWLLLFPYIRIPVFFLHFLFLLFLCYAMVIAQKGYYTFSFGLYEFLLGLGSWILGIFDKELRSIEDENLDG